MVQFVEIRDAGKKGKGVFALKDFRKGEVIFDDALASQDRKIIEEKDISLLSKKDQKHLAYLGGGKYIVDYSPPAIVNHSCNPNAYEEFNDITSGKLIARRNINNGEEITKDYTLGAVDQIDNEKPWGMECFCGSARCRKAIIGDFFKMPLNYKRENVEYLPSFVKKNYSERIKELE